MKDTRSFCLVQAVIVHANIVAAGRQGTTNVNVSETADQIVKAAEKFNEFMKKGQVDDS